jgi:hypothetical protein
METQCNNYNVPTAYCVPQTTSTASNLFIKDVAYGPYKTFTITTIHSQLQVLLAFKTLQLLQLNVFKRKVKVLTLMSLELTLLLAIEATGKYGLTGIKTAFSDQLRESMIQGILPLQQPLSAL